MRGEVVGAQDPWTCFEVCSLTDARVLAHVLVSLARSHGWSPKEATELGIVGGEIASNIARHGGGKGAVRVRFDEDGLDLTADDDGPGFDPLARPVPPPLAVGIPSGLGGGWESVMRWMDSVTVEAGAAGGTRIRAQKRRA